MIPGYLFLNHRKISLQAVAEGRIPSGLSEQEERTLCFCKDWLNGKKEFLLQTSGSTGAPKTIVAEAEKMELSARMTIRALGLSKGDKSLVCLNTDYIAGRMMLVRGLATQMEMHIIDPSSNPLKDFPEDMHFDFTALVPLQLETILDLRTGKEILDRMKGILVGGAAVSLPLEEKIQSIAAPVYHTFAMTETLSHIALRKLNGPDRSDFFHLLEGISMETDARNCLVIHSPFSEEAIRTNDVVEQIDARKFRWLGRADFTINSGGVKLHPESIEKKIEKVLANKNLRPLLFVTGLKDPKLGEAVSVIVEGKAWDSSLQETVTRELAAVLDRYEKPRGWYFIDRFIKTATGKIDRIKTAALLTQEQ